VGADRSASWRRVKPGVSRRLLFESIHTDYAGARRGNRRIFWRAKMFLRQTRVEFLKPRAAGEIPIHGQGKVGGLSDLHLGAIPA